MQAYDLFDDILLLANGRILYQGPRESVQPHFSSLGFEITGTKAEADFLQVSNQRARNGAAACTQFYTCVQGSADTTLELAT